MDTNYVAEALVNITKTDWLGRPICPLFKGMKMPKPEVTRYLILHGKDDAIKTYGLDYVTIALEVLAVICAIAKVGCPLLGDTNPTSV